MSRADIPAVELFIPPLPPLPPPSLKPGPAGMPAVPTVVLVLLLLTFSGDRVGLGMSGLLMFSLSASLMKADPADELSLTFQPGRTTKVPGLPAVLTLPPPDKPGLLKLVPPNPKIFPRPPPPFFALGLPLSEGLLDGNFVIPPPPNTPADLPLLVPAADGFLAGTLAELAPEVWPIPPNLPLSVGGFLIGFDDPPACDLVDPNIVRISFWPAIFLFTSCKNEHERLILW